MPGFLTDVSAFTVFVAIAAFGFLFLAISLVFGELFDFFDQDHDFDGGGGPSFFSSRVVSVLLTAFGALGAIGVNSGMSIPAASAMGFAGGLICASAVYFFARFLFGQQATTRTASSDLAGRTARVTVAIPKGGGLGQIRCQVGEELVDKVARTGDEDAIAANTLVVIEEVLGEVVIVKRK